MKSINVTNTLIAIKALNSLLIEYQDEITQNAIKSCIDALTKTIYGEPEEQEEMGERYNMMKAWQMLQLLKFMDNSNVMLNSDIDIVLSILDEKLNLERKGR